MADRSQRGSIKDHSENEQNKLISNTDLSNLENQRDNYQSPLPAVSPSIASEHSKDSINEHEPSETTSLLEGAREPSVRYSHFPSAREDDTAFRLEPNVFLF